MTITRVGELISKLAPMPNAPSAVVALGVGVYTLVPTQISPSHS